MTFAIYIVIIIGVFIAFLNLLPIATTIGFSFTPAVITIVGYMRAWDFMFPIHELFYFLGAFITIEIVLWSLRNGAKVIKFLRGHGDGS